MKRRVMLLFIDVSTKQQGNNVRLKNPSRH